MNWCLSFLFLLFLAVCISSESQKNEVIKNIDEQKVEAKASIKKAEVSENELMRYISDKANGLSKCDSVNEIVYKVTYRPVDFVFLNDFKTVKNANKDTIEKMKNNFSKNIYFILSLSYKGGEVLSTLIGDKNVFTKMVNTLSNEMNNYVFLINTKKDTTYVADYASPRLYGQTNANTMLFAFDAERIRNSEYLKFLVKDFGLGTGDMQFKFNLSDINNTPSLKL